MGDFTFLLCRNGLVVSFDEVVVHPEGKAFGISNAWGKYLEDKAFWMNNTRGEYPDDEASGMREAPGIPRPAGCWA